VRAVDRARRQQALRTLQLRNDPTVPKSSCCVAYLLHFVARDINRSRTGNEIQSAPAQISVAVARIRRGTKQLPTKSHALHVTIEKPILQPRRPGAVAAEAGVAAAGRPDRTGCAGTARAEARVAGGRAARAGAGAVVAGAAAGGAGGRAGRRPADFPLQDVQAGRTALRDYEAQFDLSGLNEVARVAIKMKIKRAWQITEENNQLLDELRQKEGMLQQTGELDPDELLFLKVLDGGRMRLVKMRAGQAAADLKELVTEVIGRNAELSIRMKGKEQFALTDEHLDLAKSDIAPKLDSAFVVIAS
jgi:hypothetical protein